MAKYEVFRVEDSGLNDPFDSIKCHYLTVENGAYIFYNMRAQLTPEAVYPIRSFWVVKVEG